MDTADDTTGREKAARGKQPMQGSPEWRELWRGRGIADHIIDEAIELGCQPDQVPLPWDDLLDSRPLQLVPEQEPVQTRHAPPGRAAFTSLLHAPRDPRGIFLAPFVREGDLCMITGERGQGKTTLMGDVIVSLLIDSDLPEDELVGAGAMKVDRKLWAGRDVAVLDAENEPRDWSEVITQTAMARGIRPEDPALNRILQRVHHTSADIWSLDPSVPAAELHRASLVKALVEMKVGLLIIDPLHSVYTRDLNNPEWVTEGLARLRRALRRHKITLICLVHTSRFSPEKSRRNLYVPAYSSKQENEADCIIGMRRQVKENAVRLILVKRRTAKWNLEGSKAVLHFSLADGGYTSFVSDWKLEDPRPKESFVRLTDAEARIFLSCPADGPFNYEVLDGERAKVSKLVRQVLVKYGLADIHSGSGKKGDPYTFELTALGRSMREYYEGKV